jgi:exosortase A-associated hydrolase 1
MNASTATRWAEQPLVFGCEGDMLVGVLARPALVPARDLGVLIVVGGPQYRAGSHRYFVQLARGVAAAGYACLRFDVRGMGDSAGQPPGFENLDADIEAAIALLVQHGGIRRVVLWGLCDGASAALMYVERRRDDRVAGLALLNPWVRSAATQAAAQVKHYYRQRLLEPAFWGKLLRGGVSWSAPAELVRSVGTMLRGRVRRAGAGAAAARPTFQACMAAGWRRFPGPVLLLLSEQDLTAREFVEALDAGAPWIQPWNRPVLRRELLPGADHTLSQRSAQEGSDAKLLEWLSTMAEAARG